MLRPHGPLLAVGPSLLRLAPVIPAATDTSPLSDISPWASSSSPGRPSPCSKGMVVAGSGSSESSGEGPTGTSSPSEFLCARFASRGGRKRRADPEFSLCNSPKLVGAVTTIIWVCTGHCGLALLDSDIDPRASDSRAGWVSLIPRTPRSSTSTEHLTPT